MANPSPPSVKLTFEDRLAKLREPVQLGHPYLPRFVLMMLECALNSYLASFCNWLEEVIRQHRAGTLPGWPEEEGGGAAEPAVPRYRMTSHLTAPRRGAGATHVQISPETLPQAACDASDAAGIADRGIPATSKAWQGERALCALLAQPRRWQRVMMRPADRCRSASVFSAAGQRRETCVQIIPVN